MQALSKATFHVDRFCQSHTFEALWRKNMFRIDLIDGQKDSMLMSLPLEIRLMIWKYVLSPPYNNSADILSVLATCRLVHGEAVVHALESITFFVRRSAGLEFQSKLWSLGTLAQHLRHVRVDTSFEKLDGRSANNPFILTKLPLNHLYINLGELQSNGWFSQNMAYQRLIFALLNDEAERRVFEIDILRIWATKKQLYKMLVGMQTKLMTVACTKSRQDLLWSAFSHFRLVDSYCTVLRKGGQGGANHYIIFGNGWNPDQNVVEMGRWPLRTDP
jgi:hypothetical protein